MSTPPTTRTNPTRTSPPRTSPTVAEVPVKQLLRWQDDGGATPPEVGAARTA